MNDKHLHLAMQTIRVSHFPLPLAGNTKLLCGRVPPDMVSQSLCPLLSVLESPPLNSLMPTPSRPFEMPVGRTPSFTIRPFFQSRILPTRWSRNFFPNLALSLHLSANEQRVNPKRPRPDLSTCVLLNLSFRSADPPLYFSTALSRHWLPRLPRLEHS